MITEGGEQMRICSKDIRLVQPGTVAVPARKRKAEPKKKKAARPMTAEQKRKVDELRKRVSEGCQGGINIKGAEIR